jgi:hypothetical protein
MQERRISEARRRLRTATLLAITSAATALSGRIFAAEPCPDRTEMHLVFTRMDNAIDLMIRDYKKFDLLLEEILPTTVARNLQRVLQITELSEFVTIPLSKIRAAYAARGLKFPEYIAFLHPNHQE